MMTRKKKKKRRGAYQLDLVLVASGLLARAFVKLNVDGKVSAPCVAVTVRVNFEPPDLPVDGEGLAEEHGVIRAVLGELCHPERLEFFEFWGHTGVDLEVHLLEVNLQASEALLLEGLGEFCGAFNERTLEPGLKGGLIGVKRGIQGVREFLEDLLLR